MNNSPSETVQSANHPKIKGRTIKTGLVIKNLNGACMGADEGELGGVLVAQRRGVSGGVGRFNGFRDLVWVANFLVRFSSNSSELEPG